MLFKLVPMRHCPCLCDSHYVPQIGAQRHAVLDGVYMKLGPVKAESVEANNAVVWSLTSAISTPFSSFLNIMDCSCSHANPIPSPHLHHFPLNSTPPGANQFGDRKDAISNGGASCLLLLPKQITNVQPQVLHPFKLEFYGKNVG